MGLGAWGKGLVVWDKEHGAWGKGRGVWSQRFQERGNKLAGCAINGMAQFRFQNLEIWQTSIDLTLSIFDLADLLDKKKYFRMAEQLRAAMLSISNNIAEGSGASSPKDFVRFLDFSRKSLFEVANILTVLNKWSIITNSVISTKLDELEFLSRRITCFKRSLFK